MSPNLSGAAERALLRDHGKWAAEISFCLYAAEWWARERERARERDRERGRREKVPYSAEDLKST